MSRYARTVASGLSMAGSLLFSGWASADEPPPVTPPPVRTATVSAELMELAANLDVLEDLDMLLQLEVLELLPLLEETDER